MQERRLLYGALDRRFAKQGVWLIGACCVGWTDLSPELLKEFAAAAGHHTRKLETRDMKSVYTHVSITEV